MSAGTSLGSYFRNEGNGGIGKSTYMNANATAPSTATCTNRLILPPPTGDRRGRRENTLTTGLGNGDWKIPAVSPQSRVPQFRVDLLPSGLYRRLRPRTGSTATVRTAAGCGLSVPSTRHYRRSGIDPEASHPAGPGGKHGAARGSDDVDARVHFPCTEDGVLAKSKTRGHAATRRPEKPPGDADR